MIEVQTAVLREARQHRHRRFLKGPIDLAQLAAAGRLPGKALSLLLLVHHRVDLTREPRVALPAKLLSEFGINRDAKARGLRALEEAGLIEVERAPGRAAVVCLIAPERYRGRE